MTLNFPASPTNGQVYDNFIYDSGKGTWKLQSLPVNNLDDLSDVEINTPSDGQAILYDASSGDWINQNIEIPAGTTISATAPLSPEIGQLWWDSDNGELYIYYNDGTSSQWVSAANPKVFISDTAPTGYPGQLWLDSTDGAMYTYYTDPGGVNSQWIGAVSRSGGTLQVVTAFTATPTSTTSSTFVNTSLTASITPRSTSSRIIILVSCAQLITNNAAGSSNVLLVRGNASSRLADLAASNLFTNPTQDLRVPFTIFSIDSPNTTSTTLYTVLLNSPESTSNTATINGAQRMILMEVAG